MTTENPGRTLTCPKCKKPTLATEFPDQFEVWLKCSSCNFFLGMSHDDWHRIQHSPNLHEKIQKIAKAQEKNS